MFNTVVLCSDILGFCLRLLFCFSIINELTDALEIRFVYYLAIMIIISINTTIMYHVLLCVITYVHFVYKEKKSSQVLKVINMHRLSSNLGYGISVSNISDKRTTFFLQAHTRKYISNLVALETS